MAEIGITNTNTNTHSIYLNFNLAIYDVALIIHLLIKVNLIRLTLNFKHYKI